MDFIVTDGHFLAESTRYQILVGGPILLGVFVMVIAFILAPRTTDTPALVKRNRQAGRVFCLGLATIIVSVTLMFVDGAVLPTIAAHT